MALATRCPACETIFRISTTQAAAKSGMVRCGQCRNVFNSLDALVRVEDLDVVDEGVADASEIAPAAAQPDLSAHDVDATELASFAPGEPIDEDFEAQSDAKSGVAPIAQSPAPKPAAGAVFSEWWLPQGQRTTLPSSAAPPPAPAPKSESEKDSSPRSVDNFKNRSLSDRRMSVEWHRNGKRREPEFMRASAPRTERSRFERWMLVVLSIVAALGLAAQAAYVWRNELAVRVPAAKPWLVAACAPLRCLVDYPAHIDSITIESTALQSSGPNANLYTLTALLRNRDGVAVRYPHLELTLTDTQDRPILRRALRPDDYLAASRDSSTRLQGGFSAESELPIRMMFELNDLRFVGYRLDKFYP